MCVKFGDFYRVKIPRLNRLPGNRLFALMAFWGWICLEEVILNGNGFMSFIQIYKVILLSLKPTDTSVTNFCPNPFTHRNLSLNWIDGYDY